MGGLVESFKDFSLIMKGVLASPIEKYRAEEKAVIEAGQKK